MYRGKSVNQKLVDKVESSLKTWLEKDEIIVAAFKATRVKPQTDSIIVTNRRVFCAHTIYLESGRGFINEIVASEIKAVRVDLPKSRLMRTAYPAKLIIEHPDGTEEFLASIRESDAPAAIKAIQRVSGSSTHLAIRQQVDKQHQQNKALERERKGEEKAVNKRDLEAIRAEERAYEAAHPTSSPSGDSSLNGLQKVARSSKNASKRLNKISNRLLIVVVLLVVGIIFFPIGIIAWVFAVFAFLSIFND